MLLAAVVQILHARENAAVLLQAEVVGFDDARHLEIDGVVQQNRAEHEALGIGICRETFFKCEIGAAIIRHQSRGRS